MILHFSAGLKTDYNVAPTQRLSQRFLKAMTHQLLEFHHAMKVFTVTSVTNGRSQKKSFKNLEVKINKILCQKILVFLQKR